MTEEPPAPAPVPVATEEETTLDQTQPSSPVAKPEQLIQDSTVTPALDLNEDQPHEEQDV